MKSWRNTSHLWISILSGKIEKSNSHLPLTRVYFQFATVLSPLFCTAWGHVLFFSYAISLITINIWTWDFSLSETPEFRAQWSTCCSLNKLCLQLFSTCTFAQAVLSVKNDFPPLYLILLISFSLSHPSRPNMQTTSSMKLPPISWVYLSLLWTNRRIWYSLENSTRLRCLINCSYVSGTFS